MTSTKAKAALTACGKPNGFETNMAYRAERPKEKATAESLQQALGRVGIKLTLKPLPAGRLLRARTPATRRSCVANGIGLATNGWGADWNDGFGFLSQIVDSRVIRATGGSSNLSVRIPDGRRPARRGDGRDRRRQAQRRSGARSTRPSWSRP